MTDPHPSDETEDVVPGELVDDGEQPHEERQQQEQIDQPTRLLRIAGMVKGLLNEVETTELDEAARERLTAIHTRSVAMLRDVMSDDLADELQEFTLDLDDEVPTGAELQVAQAQLAGWLEGLFHGIQASMATRQLSARQQGRLGEAMKEPGGASATGQYL